MRPNLITQRPCTPSSTTEARRPKCNHSLMKYGVELLSRIIAAQRRRGEGVKNRFFRRNRFVFRMNSHGFFGIFNFFTASERRPEISPGPRPWVTHHNPSSRVATTELAISSPHVHSNAHCLPHSHHVLNFALRTLTGASCAIRLHWIKRSSSILDERNICSKSSQFASPGNQR
jgi:hypothetical protein